MPRYEQSSRSQTRERLEEPHKYYVIMHNDDFTTMDFVVSVLMKVFYKKREEATRLMLTVHNENSAIVGKYTYDIAITKATKAMEMAREEGFPFRLTVEPTEEEDLPF